jgi:hypothetical protein
MIVTFYMEDMYNFNRGATSIPGGLDSGTEDNVNGRFSELGWATEFLTVGSMPRTVTWNVFDPLFPIWL